MRIEVEKELAQLTRQKGGNLNPWHSTVNENEVLFWQHWFLVCKYLMTVRIAKKLSVEE